MKCHIFKKTKSLKMTAKIKCHHRTFTGNTAFNFIDIYMNSIQHRIIMPSNNYAITLNCCDMDNKCVFYVNPDKNGSNTIIYLHTSMGPISLTNLC